MSKEINLEEILSSRTEIIKLDNGRYIVEDNKESILGAMKDACKQTLELAAENAYCESKIDETNWFEYEVDKQSILNTINQIK